MSGLNGLEMSQDSVRGDSNSLDGAMNTASDQDEGSVEQVDEDVGGLFGDSSEDEVLG